MKDILLAVMLSISAEDMDCLSKNSYFESRNQSQIGVIATTHVVLNRVKSPKYPNNICDVVHQGKKDSRGNMVRNACQFSWYCDGLSDKPREIETYEKVQETTNLAVELYIDGVDVTEGSTHYHTVNVRPYWAKHYFNTLRIDDHLFYRKKK
jgi:spore germination cell wall hydrolase CwlJ-like protein